MADEILLNEAERKVAEALGKSNHLDIAAFAEATGTDQSQISAAATKFEADGSVKIEENPRDEIVLSDGASELLKSGLPERRAVAMLAETGGELKMPDLAAWAKSANVAINEALKWGIARGWIEQDRVSKPPVVRLTDRGRNQSAAPDEDERAIEIVLAGRRLYLDELKDEGIDQDRVMQLLKTRPEIAKIKRRNNRIVTVLIPVKFTGTATVTTKSIIWKNRLSHEDLESGAWKAEGFRLRPYDVTLTADDVYPAKIHPLRKIIEQTRRAFLEMGFAEVVSPMVESAFWNFDALFQPQDHPAREMQDTFYMRYPAEVPLPGEEKGVRPLFESDDVTGNQTGDKKRPDPFLFLDIVEQVRRTHEDGWETGSEGWGYTWSPERSRQVVLRTHTTAATIRSLAKNPDPPGKFFCVGWTYRNETISFKHLPVFHQVDGIIIDEEANLASLMGTLQEFYSKMGFGRVKFKPAFYPYTEPSVDVVVYMESRGKWLEMGGAGIFRPEVTLPLGCKQPVLAWGLGIERLAMLRFGLSDIRELYRPSLDALEGVPLCR